MLSHSFLVEFDNLCTNLENNMEILRTQQNNLIEQTNKLERQIAASNNKLKTIEEVVELLDNECNDFRNSKQNNN